MNYKIAVCDDSEADRQYISGLVSRWAANSGHTVQITRFPSAENFLFHYAEESDYDMLLLDIEMEAMDGVTMAKELRKGNDTVQIVFITGYSDYIFEGYEVAALHCFPEKCSQWTMQIWTNRKPMTSGLKSNRMGTGRAGGL